MLHTAAVYCGSSEHAPTIYLNAAYEMGRLLAKASIDVIYGGGSAGLMGAVADGALKEKGRVFGYLASLLLEKEKAHPYLTELHLVESMHIRKCQMFDHAEAFIILPGGFGTLDEAFEVLTWRQIKLHEKQVVFVNIHNYWDPLFSFLAHVQHEQFITKEHLHFAQVVATPQEAIDRLQQKNVSHFVAGSGKF